jgi:hypothetical protein
MPVRFAAAFDAIEVFIRGILPRAEVTRAGNEQLHVRNDAQSITLTFNRSQLDDFEVVLRGNQSVRYSNGIRGDLYLPVYVALGIEGMIPDLRVSEVLLQEDRDWLATCRLVGTRFDRDIAKGLYDGLTQLQASLRLSLQSDVEVPEVRAELEVVESLTGFYEKHGHLNSPDVQQESLSYLKAAALCWILRLEEAKLHAASLRTKAAYDKKVYGIVHQFWVANPYNAIELPPAMRDYIAQRTRLVPVTQLVHRPHVDIGPLLERLDARLKNRWRGAWVALQSDNPDRVSQATNSMVEVLDRVIDQVRETKEFKDYLADRFPDQTGVVIATRKWITEVKNGLQGIKHHSAEQSPQLAEDLMHQAEWIVNLLLRR